MIRVLFFCLLIFSTAAYAVHPDEMLKDPAKEARAREISRQLRCLVCQGEDIDESNAGLAVDLRRLVRARILAGDTNAQAIEHIRLRYGDYVLMRPPVAAHTWALWFLPPLFLAGGVYAVFFRRRKGRR